MKDVCREKYGADGFAIYPEVVDAELLQELNRHLDWLQISSDNVVTPELFQFQRANDDPFWYRVVSDGRLLDIAAQYVGPDIALFGSGYFHKLAEVGSPVLWHQDAAYWPLDPPEAVTLWIAIDESTPENGCMKVIPGSHLGTVEAVFPRTDVPNILGSGMTEELVDESKSVDVVLKPGDVSVHHPNLIHGSLPNTSKQRRCGLAVRYIATSTRIECEGVWPGAFLLRGNDHGPTNRYNRRPTFIPGKHMPFRGMESWNSDS